MNIRKLLAALLACALLLGATLGALAEDALEIADTDEGATPPETGLAAGDDGLLIEADGDAEPLPSEAEALIPSEAEASETAEPESGEAALSEPEGDEAGPAPNTSDVPVDASRFPDAAFRQWVSDNADTDGDGVLTAAECAAVTEIELTDDEGTYVNVTSLRGIGFFTALTRLNVSGLANLTSLDLSDCKALENLNCAGCGLKSLDLSYCPQLTDLDCSGNALTEIDVSGNYRLKSLVCRASKLTSLNVTWNGALETLRCDYNQIETLDLSQNPFLRAVECYCNGLTELILPGNASLEWLRCEFNALEKLDLEGCGGLEYLGCAYNRLERLNIDGCTKLEGLSCQGNKLSQLGVWNCPKLAKLIDPAYLRVVTDFDYEGQYVGVMDWYSEGHTDDTDDGVKVDHDLQIVAAVPTVDEVWLDRSALALFEDDEVRLTAVVTPVSPMTASVVWSSSDSDVATVEGGCVTAIAPGKAKITVTSVADPSKKATCAVTVQERCSDREIKKTGSNGTATLNKGKQLQLIPTFAENKGWKVKSYKTSNRRVASVTQDGLVEAKKAGNATITIRTKNNKRATVKVVVKDPTVPTKIKLNTKNDTEIKLGETLQLLTTLSPDTAVSELKWKTSNRLFATVSKTGLVTAKKAGTVYITVTTENGKSARVRLKVVNPATPTKIKLNKKGTVKLHKGDTLQLEATLSPDTAVSKLTWTTSKRSVATVSKSGLVTAKKKGSATITVRTKNGLTAKVRISVVK